MPESILRTASAGALHIDHSDLNSVKAIMARSSLLSTVLLSLIVLPLSLALKFDLAAHTGHNSKYERCIRNFVGKDTLVLVTAIVDGQKGDGQMVNMHVSLLEIYAAATRVADRPGSIRSRMQWGMNTEGRKISLERQGWLSHLTRMRHLTYALRTS